MSNEEKTQKLFELIDDLCSSAFSKSRYKIDNWIETLVKIYENDYRHSYSDIFNKLQGVFLDDMETGVTLGENLNTLSCSIDDRVLNDNNFDL